MEQPNGRPRHRNRVVALATVVLLACGAAAFGAWKWYSGGLPTSTPSCSWPLRVNGTATAQQVGLVRCYVRAVARHDLPGLQALVLPDPPMRVTDAQLAHTADARRGMAIANFTPNPVSSADASVTITYRDGVSDVLQMRYANPEAVSWRLDIGNASPGMPNAPHSAAATSRP